MRTVDKSSEIHFDSKMCIGSIFIYVQKSYSPDPDLDDSVSYSFNVSTNYIYGENCSYIHENSFAYCGESNLEDCRNCKRQGCTVIQCGVESGNKNNQIFVYIKNNI